MLKQFRKKLGLTQTEMAAGIISTSFYSKVERNIHDIGVADLIKILNKHDVNPVQFFKSVSDEKDVHKDMIDRITTAFERKDSNQLLKIQKELTSLPNNRMTEYYQLQIRLNLEVYLPQAKKIPSDLKYKLKRYVFVNDNWDIYSLRIFRETMRVYEIDELSFLVNAILSKYPNPNVLQDSLKECVGAICINFLDNCYEKNSIKLTKNVIDYLSLMDCDENVLLVKILASYYDCLFNNKKQECHEILKVLNYAQYSDLAGVLPRL